ncbi:H-NS family nucleoid-associated regulatory protein [Paraburkholderia sp. RL18-101-BIB-B]|uniref:H-NS family nucleoid-associated regulatory protein n=1 Tax=Paraburkholderia sp. RL18-101-BIB-B TaxID=3031634 RepID=UPI0038BD8418
MGAVAGTAEKQFIGWSGRLKIAVHKRRYCERVENCIRDGVQDDDWRGQWEGAVEGPQSALYRDSASGATWSGRGRAPTWLAGDKDRSRYFIG